MRLLEFTTLMEGGNIWKNELATVRINQADVVPTVKFLEKITKMPLVVNMLGTTGLKPTSSDIDLSIDENKFDKEQLIKKLKLWAEINDKNAFCKKSGISVHFRCPIAGDPLKGYVQVDFMFVEDPKFSKFIMTGLAESKYKNRIRMIVMASLARSVGMRWSYTKGLTDLNGNPIPNGKDIEFISKSLLGKSSSSTDIESTESILAALKNDPKANERLADARKTIADQDKIELPMV